MQNTNKFGTLLKQARKTAHYSQTEVSKRLMLVRSTYGHFEQGVRTPSPEFILQVSALFNLNPIPFLLCFSTEEMRNNFPIYYKRLGNMGTLSMNSSPVLDSPLNRRKRLRAKSKNKPMN